LRIQAAGFAKTLKKQENGLLKRVIMCIESQKESKKFYFKYVIITIALMFLLPPSAKALCQYNSGLFGKSIGIVGDSFFATDENGLGSLQNIMGLHFHASEVQNAAIGGATALGFGSDTIVNQKLEKPLDIRILGGGGNDFGKCGTDKNCMAGKIDDFVSPNFKSGAFPKIIDKYSAENTTSVILYTSIVGNHAPKKWKYMVQSGLAEAFSKRMSSFADTKQNVIWFDAATALDPAIKSHWLKDGFHPSSFGYKLISEKLFQQLCEQ